MKQLSIVVPHYKNHELIVQTINNVRKVCKNIDYELIVINDWMIDKESERQIEKLLDKDIVYLPMKKNIWVTKARNLWVKTAKWKYICVINDDIITPEWFYEKLMKWFEWEEEDLIMTTPRYTLENDTNVYYMHNHLTWFCYMINQKWKEILFPIDERFRIFGNDNRLRMKLMYGNYACKVVKDAICHRMVSKTVYCIDKFPDKR